MFKQVKVDQLSVNKANDRHGDQGTELQAIRWLVKNKAAHMKNLIGDILAEKRVYEPPLVLKLEGDQKYTVFDGNRRVAALKIASKPSLSGDSDFQKFVEKQIESIGTAPAEITVQIEDDIDVVEEIIYRRHSGSQSGVGQSPWDPAAKENFQLRTGKHSRLNLASAIETEMQQAGALPDDKGLKRSVLNRLLSAELYRSRVGIRVRSGQAWLTHRGPVVLSALKKIAMDLSDGSLTLNAVWAEEAKLTYLAKLDKHGFLPAIEDLLDKPIPLSAKNLKNEHLESSGTSSGETSQSGAANPAHDKSHPKPDKGVGDLAEEQQERTALIPNDEDHNVTWPDGTARIKRIWNELQFRLDLSEHICAISVLERVLIELIVDRYLESFPDTAKSSDSAAQKIKKVAKKLLMEAQISADYFESLQKLMNGEEIVSVNTLNKYVHSANLNPSPQHVCAIWDTLSKFLRVCLKSA